jgi:hypothetical protein
MAVTHKNRKRAAAEPRSESGEVVAFKVPKEKIKYYDSDTVSVIANLSRCSSSFVLPDAGLLNDDKFNDDPTIRFLLHEIKQERPYFEPKIIRSDLEFVICVKPKLENPRIIRQDGAFFLFGVDGKKLNCAAIPEDYVASSGSSRILVIGKEKQNIRKQLEALGISKGSVYPEIERVAEFIKGHFATK